MSDARPCTGADDRALFAAAPDALIIHELADGRLVDVNPAMLDMFGYEREEALRLDMAALGADDPSVAEWRARRRNGERFWVEASRHRAVIAGRDRGVAVLRDIDARKRAEAAQASRRERLEHILEGTNLGTWEWNVQTGEAVLDENWAGIIGYTLDELLPVSIETWRTHVHPDDLATNNGALERHFEGKTERYEAECRMRHKDGRWVWVLDRGKVNSRTADGRPLWMFGSLQDISARKHNEDSLLRREEQYKTILQTAVDGFWLTDLEGQLLEVNESYCRMSGYDEQELLAMRIPALEGDMGPDEVAAKIDEVLREGYARFETRHRHKDGSLYDVDVSVQPLALEDGKLVIFLRDISLRKQDEQEKRSLQDQLLQSQKMEAVGRLAGGVAHDLNNMLNVILGCGEMALEQVTPGDTVHGDIQEVIKAAHRSADITRQLLAFARRQTITPRVLDLNEAVSESLKMIKRLIGEDLCLTWLPGEKVWPVRIDPAQINQILVNLCVNSRDAIDGVGQIAIETSAVSFDEDACRGQVGLLPGDFAMLSVSDDGCGMDRKTLENIFEPFFTTKSMDSGTGLGLATVYGIVKQNSGFIKAYSEKNLGTTIRIYFPRSAEGLRPQAGKQVVVPDVRGHETILLVEDEPMILTMTRKMLESLSYEVLAAHKPKQARDMAREHGARISLLLTDVVMPEMNGLELAKDLQQRIPGLECVFMSGYTADIIARRGILEEGVRFIPKPFSKRDLSIKLREALNGGGSGA